MFRVQNYKIEDSNVIIKIREEIKQLSLYYVIFVLNNNMNKTSIDFFSRGLNDRRTRLSINVFGLNPQFQQKQSPIKRRPSLSHLNFNKLDKKSVNDKQVNQKQLTPIGTIKKIPNAVISIPSNDTINIVKNKILKFQGSPTHNNIFSIVHSEFPEVSNKNPKIEGHLQKLRTYKGIKKITEEGEMNESYNTSNQMQEPLKRMHIIDKIKQISKEQYESPTRTTPEEIEKPKKYFIHNLVLQKLQNHNENIDRYNSQHKFTIRKLHPNIFLASGGMRTIQFKGKTAYGNRNEIKQIILPSSLITNRIGYNSEYIKPMKKHQSQKAILHVKKAKIRKQQEGNIDRWQLPRQENTWQI